MTFRYRVTRTDGEMQQMEALDLIKYRTWEGQNTLIAIAQWEGTADPSLPRKKFLLSTIFAFGTADVAKLCHLFELLLPSCQYHRNLKNHLPALHSTNALTHLTNFHTSSFHESLNSTPQKEVFEFLQGQHYRKTIRRPHGNPQ